MKLAQARASSVRCFRDPRALRPEISLEVLPERDSLLERAMIFQDFVLGFYITQRGVMVRRSTFDGTLLGEAKLPELTTVTAYGYGSGSELFLEYLRIS